MQRQKDLQDEVRPEHAPAPGDLRDEVWPEAAPAPGSNATMWPESDQNPDSQDAARDAAAMRLLDQLLQRDGNTPEDLLDEEDGDGQGDPEADLDDSEACATGFVNYMPDAIPAPAPAPAPAPGSGNSNITPAPPSCDALNNQYVRIIHTNGIHHMALVGCMCRGKDNMINDLIYARMVPTSFERVRTIFTTAVLDHFRLCNLEMRSSAFQFFQLLRRVSMPLSPSLAVNFYHELRRLSRLWRWIKKLKWSGYGQKPDEKVEPGAGDLTF
jgi:hypothetical protein